MSNAEDTLAEIVASTRGSMMTVRLSQEQREDIQSILDALKDWRAASQAAVEAIGQHHRAKAR